MMFPGVINPAARPDPFWLLPTVQASFLLGWPFLCLTLLLHSPPRDALCSQAFLTL